MQKVYYVYILLCADKSYYTGVTSDLEKRLYEHQSGHDENCYTFSRRPVVLKYFAEFQDINDAIAREKQVKGWSRKKKEALIVGHYDELVWLSKSHGSTDSP